LNGKPLEYGWHTEIVAHTTNDDTPWFRFRTTLHLPASLRLQQAARVEPQIILWLNSISMLMEGQAGSWRRVLLQQPTRNSLGAWGNDLPALYLLDQNDGVETMMFFDMDDMDWMSIENLPRFLVYRCSKVSHIERDGTQRMGVGLIADQATGDVLPAGDIRFTYWLLQLGSKHLSWRLFFRATEIMLLLLACSLIMNGADHLYGLGIIPSLGGTVWDSSFLLDDTTTFGGLVSALTGYRSRPDVLSLVVFVAYWVLVLWGLSRARTATLPKPKTA